MEQQVSAEDLNLILEAATYAPNGMHLETWHFTAIQNLSLIHIFGGCPFRFISARKRLC